ncbi:Glycerol kinase 1 [Schistosoma japonicum]|nr:Glycerol kinase 1 [Schistosoma japonicum]KAH8859645.1 Glycerol kinase 1 [Schistosoma japonicum]
MLNELVIGLDDKATLENVFYIPLPTNTLKNQQIKLTDRLVRSNKISFQGPDGFITGLDHSKSIDKLLVARVVVESIAFTTGSMLENCRKQARISPSVLYVDGNVARSNWLLQRISNVIGIPVERRALEECSCIGAAIAAGVGAGVWSSYSEATEALHSRLQSEANKLLSVDNNSIYTDKDLDNVQSPSLELHRCFVPQSSEICKSIKQRYQIWSRIRASYIHGLHRLKLV